MKMNSDSWGMFGGYDFTTYYDRYRYRADKNRKSARRGMKTKAVAKRRAKRKANKRKRGRA